MGGHGGLNILPQKKWNVYNYENREKVRQDEAAAAREEQLKREQSRRRDLEFRIERLREARGLPNSTSVSSSSKSSTAEADSRHINLFDGLTGFSSLAGVEESGCSGMKKAREVAEDAGSKSSKKRRREDAPVKVPPEDEKYKLGYGLVGKGVQAPWYASKPSFLSSDDVDEGADGRRSLEAGLNGAGKKSGGRKTIEELRGSTFNKSLTSRHPRALQCKGGSQLYKRKMPPRRTEQSVIGKAQEEHPLVNWPHTAGYLELNQSTGSSY
ncbi:leukocyte receptor cluster member 1 homolog [Phalaenopsis equestris]|uniref:leukocyte receptor cluster member 1 homolog n=1 Tax=Phalaenopsis equestris TaxID=78828 RepID=UPI0009E4001A|nr:leukocyte receptor cluster member 1 homolog [Phalaenopsis equestris]